MPAIEVLDTGVVYRNPRPQVVSRHAYFPSLVKMNDGELLCSMDIGQASEAVDMRTYLCRSRDGGRTWGDPSLIISPDQSRVATSMSCRVSRKPGSKTALLGLTALFDRPYPDEGLGNTKTDGHTPMRMALVESGDAGKTWSAPREIKPPIDWHFWETCYPVTDAGDGRWIFPTSPWPNWEGQRCPVAGGMAWASDDQGRTWPTLVSTFKDPNPNLVHWEQKFTTLSDGRLFVMSWVYDRAAKANRVNRWSVSSDKGRTFHAPLDTPLQGETATPQALDDNHLLVVYRRTDKRGLWAHLAKINGDRWIPLADEPLWGTQTLSYKDSQGGGAQSKMEQFTSLKFGCPSALRLDNGHTLAAFWCVEENVSNIRWYRIAAKG